MSRLSRVIYDPDTTPPTVPTGLAGVVNGQNRIDLSWNASTDAGGSGLAGYDILKDAVTTILGGVQTSYSDTGLAAGSTHTYRVRARDGNGNLSAYGSQISATTQSSTPSSEYDFMDAPVGYTDHWVGTGTTNGTGDFATPYTMAQMLAFPIAGGRHRFILKPGTYNVTGVVASDSKMPFLDPTSSGTAANPVLVKAQFAATNASTTPAQLSIIRRTSGAGSILGTQGRSYWRWDGFKITGTHGGHGFENAHIVLRSCTGWWFTRFHIDDEFASIVTLADEPSGSTNGGGMFMQLVSNCVLRDFIIENLGQAVGSNLKVWQPVEFYDATDNEVSYFTLRNIWGIGVHMKGAPAVQFQRNRIHHFYIYNCADSGINPFDVEAGTDTANHNFWWNGIVDGRNTSIHCSEFNIIGGPHRGTHFQNITMRASLGGTLMFRPGSYSSDISIRNCVFDAAPEKHLEWLSQAYPISTNSGIVFDYNRYNNFPVLAEADDGNSNTLDAWKFRSSQDANSDDSANQYVNASAGNYVTHPSVPANRPDTWGLYGPAGALVPVGCWQTTGHRTNV